MKTFLDTLAVLILLLAVAALLIFLATNATGQFVGGVGITIFIVSWAYFRFLSSI